MITNNYLNYIGSKDRYLPQILDLLKKAQEKLDADILVDLFCGSAVVAMNAKDYFKKTICYDACEPLIAIHKWLQGTESGESAAQEIDNLVKAFGLSKDDKENFIKLRSTWNTLRTALGQLNPAMLYCLVTHSYNYSFHFNKKGEYNAPSGATRSSFNSSLRKKMINWKDKMENGSSISFNALDFRKVFTDEWAYLTVGDNLKTVFFIDPPYSASVSKHPYRNPLLKWDEDEDRELIKYLDMLNDKGHIFVFTNVLVNNGITNVILKNWIAEKGYRVVPVSIDYNNCSYQRRNEGNTEEVIITNLQ